MTTTKTAEPERETGRGRPRTEKAPPPQPSSASEQRRELASELELRKAELSRARSKYVAARNAHRGFSRELGYGRAVHVRDKLDSLDLRSRLSDDTDAWLLSMASHAGDPIAAPPAAHNLFELEKAEQEFRKWLGARVDALAATPALNDRTAEQIEADMATAREREAEAEAAVKAAEEAEREAADNLRAVNDGRRPR